MVNKIIFLNSQKQFTYYMSYIKLFTGKLGDLLTKLIGKLENWRIGKFKIN